MKSDAIKYPYQKPKCIVFCFLMILDNSNIILDKLTKHDKDFYFCKHQNLDQPPYESDKIRTEYFQKNCQRHQKSNMVDLRGQYGKCV